MTDRPTFETLMDVSTTVLAACGTPEPQRRSAIVDALDDANRIASHPLDTLAVLWAVTRGALDLQGKAIGEKTEPDDVWAPSAFDLNGQSLAIDDVPEDVKWATRWYVAALNDDFDTALALWTASAPSADAAAKATQSLMSLLLQVWCAAIDTLKEVQA